MCWEMISFGFKWMHGRYLLSVDGYSIDHPTGGIDLPMVIDFLKQKEFFNGLYG
jgi:hypothetical protein